MERPYISGPMAGKPNLNFPMFYRVEQYLRDLGMDPINPARAAADWTWERSLEYALAHPRPWSEYIRRDVRNLTDGDGIVLTPGWRTSKGACVETLNAVLMGYEVWTYSGVLVRADVRAVYEHALGYLRTCGLGGVPASPQLI